MYSSSCRRASCLRLLRYEHHPGVLRIATVMRSNPMVDRIPARHPTMRAPKGWTTRSAAAPMATPPARVAFSMCSYRDGVFYVFVTM